METYHIPVLLKASVDKLVHNPAGIYADATFGGGGHSREILSRLSEKGRLLGFDRDTDAIQNSPADKRFTLVNHNFRFMKQFLGYLECLPADGILADLGISSHQIDEPKRGFAHRLEGPLDMRMDKSSPLTASKIINEYSEKELYRLFRTYGEIPNAGRLAGHICRQRGGQKIESSEQFKQLIEPCTPKHNTAKYLSQVYQALRIEVNGELSALQTLLETSPDMLKPGGRLVIISYHSLEDRMVKNFLQTGNISGEKQSDLYGNIIRPFDPEGGNGIVPDEIETSQNRRARSARMRIGIRR
jgi:16S rRNA (cytosine1402-N4)-methyltransferase